MVLLVLFMPGLIAQLAAEIDGTVTVTGVTEGSRIPAGSTTAIGVTYNPITTPHFPCPSGMYRNKFAFRFDVNYRNRSHLIPRSKGVLRALQF